jgi:hypothetical protein
MPDPNVSREDQAHWAEPQALDLWKYFGNTGTADKNTMVTVAGVMLSFSAALIGYVVASSLLCFHPLSVSDPTKAICVALLGIALSFVIVRVSLIYGGYSNWNWAQADAIARDMALRIPRWERLKIEYAGEFKQQLFKSNPRGLAKWALDWGTPCNPATELAPIFRLYVSFAVVSAGLCLFLLVVALASQGAPSPICKC